MIVPGRSGIDTPRGPSHVDSRTAHIQSCSVLCPLCNRRKARRQCPAVGQEICAVCCGTKRLVEIRCPSDCGYLSAARSHPPAVVQRQQQRDFAALAPTLQGLTDPQSRLLLLLGRFIARHAPQDFQTLHDDDIIEAASALAATLETAGRGVIYEHRAVTQPARYLAEELKRLINDIGRSGDGITTADTAVVLRRIEQGAREIPQPAGGRQSAYRDLLARILNASAADQETASLGRPSSLILP